MLYYNARFYDPQLGIFISPDSMIPDPTDYYSYNRYLYARGNPLKYNDPTGHCIFGIDTAVCIAIALGVLKAIDYGWTAWDAYQDGRTLADPYASRSDKLMAGLNLGLAAMLEAAEPDDILPVGLPLDDVGRRALLSSAREALSNGGEAGLETYLRQQLGDNANIVLKQLGMVAPNGGRIVIPGPTNSPLGKIDYLLVHS